MKLNQFFSFTVLAFLFTAIFLIGCGEWDREIMFPDLDLPESVTVTIENVPEGAAFDLGISTDYSEHKNNFGNTVYIYNYNEESIVAQDFNKTFPLETEERTIVVILTCTHVGPISENTFNSVRLRVRFNGEGDFEKGNHDAVHPFEVGTTITAQSTFSRYDGTSRHANRSTHIIESHPYQ